MFSTHLLAVEESVGVGVEDAYSLCSGLAAGRGGLRTWSDTGPTGRQIPCSPANRQTRIRKLAVSHMCLTGVLPWQPPHTPAGVSVAPWAPEERYEAQVPGSEARTNQPVVMATAGCQWAGVGTPGRGGGGQAGRWVLCGREACRLAVWVCILCFWPTQNPL